MAQNILSGIRVLDFGRYIAAPYCAGLLAQLGADVVRVESIEGNDDRFVMPVNKEQGALYVQVNQNKKSLPINLQHEKAPALIRRLVEKSDVVIANMVPKLLARMGLDYKTLSAIKPDIILTNITAFGAQGPEQESIGFDVTGQAMSGAIHLTGWEGQQFRAAVSYVDYGTALASAFATMAAIYAKSQTGKGQEVQTSLLRTALTIMNPMLIEEASGARSRVPTGNRSPISGPSDIFSTKDRRIVIQVIGQQMFQRWATLMGREDLVKDPRFADDIGRGENGEVLSEIMQAWCKDKISEECFAILRKARIPTCAVLTAAEALKEPQHLEGGFFNWMNVPGISKTIPCVTPFKLSGPMPDKEVAPALGEGSDAFLQRVGFTTSEIASLRQDGVL